MDRDQLNTTVEDPKPKGLRRSFHGVMYQIIVLIFFIFRYHKKCKEEGGTYTFNIEKNDVDILDDIVIEHKIGNRIKVTYIQATHTQDEESKSITGKTLLSKDKSEKLSLINFYQPFINETEKLDGKKEMEVSII